MVQIFPHSNLQCIRKTLQSFPSSILTLEELETLQPIVPKNQQIQAAVSSQKQIQHSQQSLQHADPSLNTQTFSLAPSTLNLPINFKRPPRKRSNKLPPKNNVQSALNFRPKQCRLKQHYLRRQMMMTILTSFSLDILNRFQSLHNLSSITHSSISNFITVDHANINRCYD